MTTETFDYLSGEVGEPTTYTPPPIGRYKAVIVKGEMVDPVAMGWEPGEDLDDAAKEEFSRPFPRVRWQLEAGENGEPSEYAGRIVDQRISLRSGTNPKTGRSYAETRADLMRLAAGLGAKDEVVGMKLIDVSWNGLDRDEALRLANEQMGKYEGLRGTIRVIHIKNKRTGEMRESVGKIVL